MSIKRVILYIVHVRFCRSVKIAVVLSIVSISVKILIYSVSLVV